MDVTTAGFYAAVCGALAGAAPYLGAIWTRIILGAAVGIAASALLPALRGIIGVY